MLCAEVQQSVESSDDQLAGAELCTSEQSDSEPMEVVDTGPAQSVDDVKLPMSSHDSSVDSAAMPTDVNFNCSSSHIDVAGDEYHLDVTALRRPALFDQTASEVVDSRQDHEKVCTDEVVNVDNDVPSNLVVVSADSEFHANGTALRRSAMFAEAASEVVDSREKIYADEITHSDDVVSSAYNAALVDDDVTGLRQPAVFGEPALEVVGSNEKVSAYVFEHTDAVVSSTHDAVSVNDKFQANVTALRRPALFAEAVSEIPGDSWQLNVTDVEQSDDNVLRSCDAVLTHAAVAGVDVDSSRPDAVAVQLEIDDLLTTSSRDIFPADEEEVCISQVHDTESPDDKVPSSDHEVFTVDAADRINHEADEAVSAAANDKNVTVAANMDTVVSAPDTQYTHDDDDDEYQLSSQQPHATHPYPATEVSASPAAEKHADETVTCFEPQFHEVVLDSVAAHARSVDVVLSAGLYTSKQLSPDIAGSVNIITFMGPECETVDVADVETVEKEVDTAERHSLTEKVELAADSADLQHSTASPTSMFFHQVSTVTDGSLDVF